MSEKEAPRQSRIRKSITRKYNLGNYENIDVVVDQEHTIEWTSLEEFMKKSANITKLVNRDFMDTISLVAEELSLEEKKAFVNEYGPAKSNTELAGKDNDFDSLD